MNDVKAAILIAALALPVAAVEGGHAPEDVRPVARAGEDRATVLEEMWQRRLLSPNQRAWAPEDLELLQRMRRDEEDALTYLQRLGDLRRWTVRRNSNGAARLLLTKEGHDAYIARLTQDALDYFESRGADAKWAFQLLDWDGKPMFDSRGRVTEAGAIVYHRAKRRLEVYWQAPNGETFGTRRPPKRKP